MEDQLDVMQEQLQSTELKLGNKVEREELTKVKSYFQRFAEYKDLKHLHGLVLPEIAKFE
jgi:hypothetical protein